MINSKPFGMMDQVRGSCRKWSSNKKKAQATYKFFRTCQASQLLLVFLSFSTISMLLLIFMANTKSPSSELKTTNTGFSSRHFLRNPKLDLAHLGPLSKVMVEMIPNDLPFTVFVPSENLFRQVLQKNVDAQIDWSKNLTSNESIFAIVSRVLAFSAVPEKLIYDFLPQDEEVEAYAISGFRLSILKTSDGSMLVNNLICNATDLRTGEIVMHVVNGILMDAEFEQSLMPQDEEGDDD